MSAIITLRARYYNRLIRKNRIGAKNNYNLGEINNFSSPCMK